MYLSNLSFSQSIITGIIDRSRYSGSVTKFFSWKERCANIVQYMIEALRIADPILLVVSFRYWMLGKMPEVPLIVRNRSMGVFYCRRRTTDFMYTYRSYERRIKNYLVAKLIKDVAFVDVGSCIGDFSVWASERAGHCFAFEPISENYKNLTRNVRLNGCSSKVTTNKFGLGEKKADLQFNVRKHNKGASGRLTPQIQSNLVETVEIRRFDEIWAPLSGNIWNEVVMKIDVEGMELDVLKGAQNFIRNTPGLSIIMESTITDVSKICTFLEGLRPHDMRRLDRFNLVIEFK